MTLLAVAVAGRGLVDPAEPVFRGRRRGAPARRRRVRDAARLRRPAVPARATTSTASASRAEALALPWRRTGSEELVELVVGRRAARPRAAALPDRSQALVATAAALPPGLEELRARGLTLQELRAWARRRRSLAGAKTTSYAVSFAARREAGARQAPTTRSRRRGPSCSRPRPRTSGGARRRALHAGRPARECCPASRAALRSSSLEPVARGRVRARRAARAPTRRSRPRRSAR